MSEKLGMSDTPLNQIAGEQHVVPAELLDQLKQEMHERSETEGRIVELGTLSGEKNEHLWTGGISLKRRLDPENSDTNDKLTIQEVNVQTARINLSYVPTTPGAAKRCIDGSTILGYDDNDPRWYTRGLGPQIQGGSLGEAVAIRMWNGVPENEDISLEKDLDKVAAVPSQFSLGDHTDDHSEDGAKTGCGQYDGQKRKLPRYNDAEHAEVIASTSDTILSLADIPSQKAHFSRLQDSAAKLEELPEYFAEPLRALAALRDKNPQGVETLVRPHNEISLTINLVSNTTFHRDHYNAQTGSKIQNFGLDAWAIIQEYGEAGYALVADAVATAMDLTDGSLLLFARFPSQTETALAA